VVTAILCFSLPFHESCIDFRLAAVTENRSDIEAAMKAFEKTIDRFPNCTEGYALYGQVLNVLYVHQPNLLLFLLRMK
jgi:hypothetical protein